MLTKLKKNTYYLLSFMSLIKMERKIILCFFFFKSHIPYYVIAFCIQIIFRYLNYYTIIHKYSGRNMLYYICSIIHNPTNNTWDGIYILLLWVQAIIPGTNSRQKVCREAIHTISPRLILQDEYRHHSYQCLANIIQ